MEEEEWRDIPGLEGQFQISRSGKVKSLPRVTPKGASIEGQIIKSIAYPRVNLNGKNRSIHRMVYEVFGEEEIDPKKVIHHKDENTLNPHIDNLEQVTQRKNMAYAKSGGTSKYTGVCWNKANQKFHAQITVKGKKMHLGYFTEEKEAHYAYLKAAYKHRE